MDRQAQESFGVYGGSRGVRSILLASFLAVGRSPTQFLSQVQSLLLPTDDGSIASD